jgi:hypothetical protein
MHRPFGRRRLAPAALVAVLALAGAASAQVVQLPPNGQVNDDPAVGIDPNQDAGVSDVVGGALDATKPAVPWGTFEQKSGTSQQVFVRVFKNGAWQTQGQSLNIQANQVGEGPSIDFAGTGRTVPWTSWYEPNSDIPGAKTQIFASRFNAAGNTWIPEGQDRAPQNRVPSLNIHLDQDAENPALVGGAAKPGADPVPWVAWQETDGAAAKDQIFVSRAVKQSDCTGFTPSANASVSSFCWQQVGLKRVDASSLDFNANGDPSLDIDPKRDGVNPDFAFTGAGDTVPWVVWYEENTGTTGLRTNKQVFAAKAVADTSAGAGGFHWQAVGNGTAGQTNVLNAAGGCSTSQDAEDKCSLNLAPGHDAEDPRVAAGTQTPGGTTVPWVTWTEDNGSGIHQIFVSHLVGDHFELMNDGQPISTVVNDSTRPDITFSRHTPYVSWIENVNGTLKTFVGHFEGNAFKLDTTAGAADADIRSPISSNCIATPFNADGEACQAGAAGTPYFLYLNGSTGVKRLLAKAYAPSDVVTGAASNVSASSATIAGSLNSGGAPTKAHVEFGSTTAYGAATADQIVGPATTSQPFSAQLSGLPSGTTVHYRVVALNDTGTVVNGADQTLTTLGNPAGHKKPKLTLLGGHLVVRIDRHGRVHLRVRSSAAIKGTLAVTRGSKRLGSATVSLKAGKQTTITIKLSRKARSLVRHARHQRLSALEKLTARDAFGATAKASKHLTIKR